MVSATVLTALQVAVAASVFLAGLLAVRIHADLDSAKERAFQAIRRLDELTRDGRVITPEDAAISGRNYLDALQPDPLARWSNFLAAGTFFVVVAITVIGCHSAGWHFTLNPLRFTGDFWVLAMMCLIDGAVVALQFADVRWVRTKLAEASKGSLLSLATEAERLFESGKHQEALAVNELILKRWPSYLGPLNNYALCLSALGHHEEALKTLTFAIARWPDPTVVACILINRAACHMHLGQHSKARMDLRQALILEPLNPETYLASGNAWQRVQLHLKAIHDFNTGLRLAAEDISLRTARAVSLLALGSSSAALDDLNIVLTMDPEQGLALRTRARILGTKGKHAEAFVDFEKGLLSSKVANTELQAYAYLALVVDRPEVAEETFSKLIDLDPSEPENWTGRALARAAMGREQEALSDIADAPQLSEQERATKRQITRLAFSCFLQSKVQDYDGALRILESELENDPNIPDALINAAQCHFMRERRLEATQLVDRAREVATTRENLLEIEFLRYCFSATDSAAETRSMLEEGTQILSWDFSPVVEKSISDGHSDPATLRHLMEQVQATSNAAQ